MKTVSVHDVRTTPDALLLDVRTPAEYDEVHVPGAVLHPLSDLRPQWVSEIAGKRPVFVMCRTGIRARQACQLLSAAGMKAVALVDGGMEAWKAANLAVVRGPKTISLERQVRITAGLLVLTGVVLGTTVHGGFYGLAAFVGAGLVFAGISDWCGMGMLLARMPWNQRNR